MPAARSFLGSAPGRPAGPFPPAFLNALLVLLALTLASCGGDSEDTATPPEDTGEFGCSGGKAGLFASWRLCWGDLHAHTVYSDDAATAEPAPGPPEKALAWARDPLHGNLDFVALTDHAETLTEEEWNGLVAAIQGAESADFVPFLGFEYTNISRQPGHGHKCVLLKEPTLFPADPPGADDCANPADLWRQLDASPAAGQYMTIPHHPAKGIDYGANMSTDWTTPYVNAEVQPLVEIYSAHGSSEIEGCEEPVQHFQEDKTVDAALERWRTTGNPGYKLGIVGSTDNHKSTPGSVAELEENVAEREGAYTGGLAAVWATTLSRDGIWQGLQDKRTYGTSGARIALEFTAKMGSQIVPMGGTLHAAGDDPAAVYLHVFAEGETGAGIRKIEIFKNGALLTLGSGNHLDFKDTAASAPSYYRVKVYQTETAMVDPSHYPRERAWSSPIWLE